jgi:hypothetical protein
MASQLTVGLGLRKKEKTVNLQQYLKVVYVESPEDVSWASRNPRWLRTNDTNGSLKITFAISSDTGLIPIESSLQADICSFL